MKPDSQFEQDDARVLALVQRALAEERARQARARWALLGGCALVASVVLVVWTKPAWAQAACTQSLPTPLVTLCADAPARASDLNGNTQQLVTWLTQKVGAVGSANVAVGGTLSVAGDTTLGRLLPAFSTWGPTGSGGAGIVNDNGAYQSLMIVGNNSAGGSRRVRVFDDLAVDANLSVGGRVDIGLEVVRCVTTTECLCPTGKTVLSGGCWTDSGVRYQRPIRRGGSDGWTCNRVGEGNLIAVYAVCARVQPIGGAIAIEP